MTKPFNLLNSILNNFKANNINSEQANISNLIASLQSTVNTESAKLPELINEKKVANSGAGIKNKIKNSVRNNPEKRNHKSNQTLITELNALTRSKEFGTVITLSHLAIKTLSEKYGSIEAYIEQHPRWTGFKIHEPSFNGEKKVYKVQECQKQRILEKYGSIEAFLGDNPHFSAVEFIKPPGYETHMKFRQLAKNSLEKYEQAGYEQVLPELDNPTGNPLVDQRTQVQMAYDVYAAELIKQGKSPDKDGFAVHMRSILRFYDEIPEIENLDHQSDPKIQTMVSELGSYVEGWFKGHKYEEKNNLSLDRMFALHSLYLASHHKVEARKA